MNETTIQGSMEDYAHARYVSIEIARKECMALLFPNGSNTVIRNSDEFSATALADSAKFEVEPLYKVNELLLFVDRANFLPDADSREVSICLDNPTQSTLASGVYTRVNDRIIYTSGAGYSIFEQLAQCGLNLNDKKNMQTLQSILEKLFDSPDNSPRRLRFDSTGNFCN